MRDTSAWLLFLHQLPPKPDYMRVKVRRRLKGLGAALVKNTVYVLPNTDEALEDFQWLREEIVAQGGTAIIAEASFVEGISDEELHAMIESAGSGPADADAADSTETIEPGRTWVTRQGVFVDRIASAWLIRRSIDPKARFKFVSPRGYKPLANEVRFDMVGAEYTHVGEDCTYQTLLRRFGLDEPGLFAIGEVVHDIDCKDEKFARPETPGVLGVLRGIADGTTTDEERLERGFRVFEDLYLFYSSRRRGGAT
ncbi:MAG TPA: chromate resistance protein ChrB domain-containing protein [Gemmatimonadaceae bacterium]|jgi:hypothetical protein|nr:chromate resistance protein ChrB domain-containing protein [Gemmatimonadaceae bacterium]